MDFGWLIDPLTRDVFFSEFWEKKPLHIARADESRYGSIITARGLDNLIASGHLRHPALQLARDGYYLPPELYTANVRTGGETFSGVILLDRVSAQYRSGATISLPAVERAAKPIAAFMDSLEKELGHAVQANAYLTAGGTPGFKPHYDTHDIFVMQIGGRKHWKIYKPPIALPYRTQIFNPQTYVLPKVPLAEVTLDPGDLLYLPRGHVHTTATGDRYSSHVTIAVTVYTWLDLTSEFLQFAKSMPEFRKALPPGFLKGGMDKALAESVLVLLDRLREKTNGETLVRGFVNQVEARKQKPDAPFESDVMIDPARMR